MAKQVGLSNVAAQAAANAITAQLDLGTAAEIVIYDGVRPSNVDDAVTTQTALAKLLMSATSFGAATDANPGALITANAISDEDSALDTGVATWARIYTQDGGTAKIDLNVGEGSAYDINLSSANIVATAVVSITSATLLFRER